MAWEKIINELVELNDTVEKFLIREDEIPDIYFPFLNLHWVSLFKHAFGELKFTCHDFSIQGYVISALHRDRAGQHYYGIIPQTYRQVTEIVINEDNIFLRFDNGNSIHLTPSSMDKKDVLYFILIFPQVWEVVKAKLQEMIQKLKHGKAALDKALQDANKISKVVKGIKNALG